MRKKVLLKAQSRLDSDIRFYYYLFSSVYRDEEQLSKLKGIIKFFNIDAYDYALKQFENFLNSQKTLPNLSIKLDKIYIELSNDINEDLFDINYRQQILRESNTHYTHLLDICSLYETSEYNVFQLLSENNDIYKVEDILRKKMNLNTLHTEFNLTDL